jgi:hypothetical protein
MSVLPFYPLLLNFLREQLVAFSDIHSAFLWSGFDMRDFVLKSFIRFA